MSVLSAASVRMQDECETRCLAWLQPQGHALQRLLTADEYWRPVCVCKDYSPPGGADGGGSAGVASPNGSDSHLATISN